MTDFLWRLSGPAVFLGRLVEYARRGISVVVAAVYSAPPDMALRISECLRADGLAVDQIVAHGLPMELVSSAIGCESGSHSLDGICAACHGVRCIVAEVGESGDASSWSSFLQRLQRRARQNPASQRPVMILVHRCPWPGEVIIDDVAMTTLAWDDAVSRADLLAFGHALLMRKRRPGVLRQVLVQTLADVCLTDLSLMRSMASEPFEEISFPYHSLRIWAQLHGLFACGEEAARIHIEGQTLAHSAWLALREDRSAIRRRVWAAQAKILLPWIEEQRSKLLPDLAPWLPRHHDGQPLDECEVGTIDFLLSRTSACPELKANVRTLKKARNEIAHCRPLCYGSLICLARLEHS